MLTEEKKMQVYCVSICSDDVRGSREQHNVKKDDNHIMIF